MAHALRGTTRSCRQTFVDRLAAAARAAAGSPELEAVVEAKLYDTITDLSVIARLALDLRNVSRKWRQGALR